MTKRKPLPDVEYLRSLFAYEPDTGVLRWKVDRAQMKVGDIAGHQGDKDGRYVRVSVDGQVYRGHLIIWKMVAGEEPKAQIDHENTIKNDNRWLNLREANKSQNQANIGLISTNKSGLKGVSRYAAGEAYGKPWQASIRDGGKSRHLGHFATKEDAHAAYRDAAVEVFGNFARMT